MSDPYDRLDTYIREGRLIRKSWTDGHDRACLLAALAPECGVAASATACPAEIMPPWLAELTVSFDDCGTDAAWPAMVQRFSAVARRWPILDAAAWQRAEYAARAIAVREAMTHTTDVRVLDVCTRVAVLCEGVAAGGRIDASAFKAAAEAAWEAAEAWEAAWAEVAAAAESAAKAAKAKAAAWALAARALAAKAAAWALAAKAVTCAAAAAGAAAAAEAAWDRMTAAILGVLEDECAKAGVDHE